LCPYVEIPRQFSLTIARWLTHVYDADQPIGISTTPRDVTFKSCQPDHIEARNHAEVARFRASVVIGAIRAAAPVASE